MSNLAAEIFIVILLVLVNGLFAMAEIAIVSVRKARFRKLAEQGDARARAALELAESPSRFLSTVQVGITLVGVLAGAFGGATLARTLAGFVFAQLQRIPREGDHFSSTGFRFEVAGMDRHRVDKVLIQRLPPPRTGTAAALPADKSPRPGDPLRRE